MKTKTPHEEKLLGLIEPVAADLGFEVVRVRVFGGARRKQLQVMAERPPESENGGTMTIEDCTDLSRALSAVLDVADPFTGEWQLEVSSPGIDRPLTELAHFARWAGHEVRIELDRPVDGRKRFSGALTGVEGSNVLVELSSGEGEAAIPFEIIGDAKLVLTDALIAEALKNSEPDADAEADAAEDHNDEIDEHLKEEE